MDVRRWAVIESLYHAALEKGPRERSSYLAAVCAGDAGLRREVESLLVYAGAQFSNPGQRSKLAELAGQIAGIDVSAAGEAGVIGRYRIVALLGEGGMGAVYEAEQEQPRRTVALKVIKPGLASPEMLRRFEQESQALARLQHPGIAQIYEAGAADSGFGPQPFFAMELIRGESLLRYAEAHQLNARQKLELIARVCEAVHHAHQRGIIHRDLKPGNILVDESGQPKILDFGVARATDIDARATRQTDLGQLVGTLAYMSPEQVSGDPLELDTRSDVYSLGVILFELLAGRQPYEISHQITEAVQAIREKDPAPLSSVSRTYRGDIEIIVAKTLEKDKTRRYSSAADLGADIQRFLKDEPITARRPTAVYQMRKFARRHRALVTGIATVFAVLCAGIVTSAWEAAQATRAQFAALLERDRTAAAEQVATKHRDAALRAQQAATAAEARAREERNRAVAEKRRADTEAAAARAVNDFLQHDLLAQASATIQARSDTKPDPDLKVRTALDRAAARVDGKFEGQPLVEASIRQTIGDAYRDLGLYADAQRHLERALELRRRAMGEEHRDTLSMMQDLGFVYERQGKHEQAEQVFTKGLETQRRVLGEEHPDTLQTMNGLALLYWNRGKYAQAEPLSAKAFQVRRRTLGEEHPDTLEAMNNLALIYQNQGKYEEAESLVVKGLTFKRRVLGNDHPSTLIGMNNLATIYLNEGKYSQAEPVFTETLDARRRILGQEHPDTLISMSNLAALYRLEGRYAQAEPLLTKVLEVKRRVMGGEHPSALVTMDNLATVYRDQGNYANAEPLYLEVLEIRRRVLGERHPRTLDTISNLAILRRSEGRYAEAEPMFTGVLDARRRALGADHPDTLATMNDLALLYQNEARYLEAESLLHEALSGYRKGTSGGWERYACESLLGASLAGQKRYQEAEPLLLAGYEGMIRRETTIPAASRFRLEQARQRIVEFYQARGELDKAAEWREKPPESTSATSESRP